MNKPRKVILITGGTGYTGSNMIMKYVLKGYCVHVLVRKTSNTSSVSGYVNNNCIHIYDGVMVNLINIMQEVQPDIVIHLASLTKAVHTTSDINDLIDTNVKLGTQIAEAMSVTGVSNMINTSTYWQHYSDEDYNPVCLYAATKQAYEDILRYYAELENLKIINMIPFDIYGPHDTRPKLFYQLESARIHDVCLEMTDPDKLLDLIYIDDVIDAFQFAEKRFDAEGVVFERYKISSGRHISLKEIVEKYEQVNNVNICINWGEKIQRPREINKPWQGGVTLDGWAPKTDLETGIRALKNTYGII